METLDFIPALLDGLEEYRTLVNHIRKHRLPAAVTGLASIHKNQFAAALCRSLERKLLYLAADEAEAVRTCEDLEKMGLRACFCPARDIELRPLEGRSHEYEHSRIEALSRMVKEDFDVAVVCADGAAQLTIPPEQLRERMITLSAGAELSPQTCVNALAAAGYQRCEMVEGAGQFSLRGGILDFFPPDAAHPIRAEFWGDTVDTIRSFDIDTQRSLEPVETVGLLPAAELVVSDKAALAARLRSLASKLRGKASQTAGQRLLKEADDWEAGVFQGVTDRYLPLLCDRPATIFDYLPQGALIVVSEHVAVQERLKNSEALLTEEIKSLMESGILCKGLDTFTLSYGDFMAKLSHALYLETFTRGGYAFDLQALVNISARQHPVWNGKGSDLIEELKAMLDGGTSVILLGGTPRSCEGLYTDIRKAGLPVTQNNAPRLPLFQGVTVAEGGLSGGFEYLSVGLAVLSWGRYSHPAAETLKGKRAKNALDLQNLNELHPGDYVVHSSYGIGTFGGIEKIRSDGVTKDFIRINYAKSDVLYVPITQLDMVSKYIGGREDGTVKVNRLGTDEWARQKRRVQKHVADIAEKLVKIYAERMQAEGYAFDADTEWQREFEDRFAYPETFDQLKAVEEIKHDMERATPMDRLLCGDVGFGKTEVALRAAFKCMIEGRQCAILVPTTILAWQHFQTAASRFDAYPFRIEILSRFRTPKQQTEILRRLKRGDIDLIIGTHKLIQKNVEFRDLGLAVIDEEQRFGVAQKERFKERYPAVDILTLSATPIPRTLNMAMSGLRDISSLNEPPQDRHPVQTYIIDHDDGMIAEAIHRELRRGGQVFYLHNRVEDIDLVAARVAKMAPEARVVVGHGQMAEEALSEVWRKLLDHEADILVCTTIIETGVDIPNCNTLIIENACNFGLAQLHQIRGRVGRSSRRAYAYLTVPPFKSLTETASKRLEAIREFTEFGSGMKIAMRDLQIRGAGNLLGSDQSGQVESVGYDMYMKLLGAAVRKVKGEAPLAQDVECLVDIRIEAHIPESYIQSSQLRLEVYRLIASVRSEEDASAAVDELIDRFGEPPKAVMGLITVSQLRSRAAAAGIKEIRQGEGRYLLYCERVDFDVLSRLSVKLPKRVTVVDKTPPYYAVKINPDLSPDGNLREILDALKEDKPQEDN
ncbi:MAG: transcription-repair coupling factor [Clostridia bacterium]|nr:transcription-repair coupling factor [Clostridia bacterium]